MKNFKLTIEYDGTHFKGWQIQKNGERTVQGELTKACQNIFKSDVTVIASGRTDSGVHAKGQVVHVKATTRINAKQIIKALNSQLPQDIAVVKAQVVADDFHAQYSVKEKTYCYSIYNGSVRSPLLMQHALFHPHALNISLMRQAAKVLIGRHDFKSFQAHDPLRAHKDTVRTVKKITITKTGQMLQIKITANGFLYKMVRNIVGALMAVAGEHMTLQELRLLLQAKDRTQAPATAPAHGLMLFSVKY